MSPENAPAAPQREDRGGRCITLEVVGGGLGEWPAAGPHGNAVAPFIFLDAESHPDAVRLPEHAGAEDWHARATWLPDGAGLRIELAGEHIRQIDVPLELPKLAALVAAIKRDGLLYVCPTTPNLGINARLARDHSFLVRVVGEVERAGANGS